MSEHFEKDIDRMRGDIKELYSHADIANREMSEVKRDVAWLREAVDKIDTRVWYVLATIILGFLIQIALKFVK